MKYILFVAALSMTLLLVFPSVANATVIVTNGLSHSHRMGNIDKARGIIELKNVGKKRQRVRFYVMDQSMDCETGGTFFEPGILDRTNAEWITLANNEATLDTGEVLQLAYEVNKPADLANEGSYWSMIMVENVQEVSEKAPERGIRVQSNLRYAVQVISEVGEESEYDMEFDTVYYDTTLSKLIVEVSNPSITIMRMFFELRVFSESGQSVNYIDESFTKLYPGTCRQIQLPMMEAEAGNYDGVIIAKSENQGVFGYNLKFEIPR